MKIDIKEISKISLEKGDVLVIKRKPAGFRSAGESERVDKMLGEVFPDNKVIFALDTDSFEVIKQELLK